MQRLLIRNISKLVSCDEGDTVYENVDLYAEDGVIRAIGPKLEKPAEEDVYKRQSLRRRSGSAGPRRAWR